MDKNFKKTKELEILLCTPVSLHVDTVIAYRNIYNMCLCVD